MSRSTSTPLVSVLMTAYNRERLIVDSIESVLRSTYSNFELIVVDDNSTDSTFEAAYEYMKNDNRVRVFKNRTNIGDYANRNKAASYANGKYLKYVDSDDLIYPHGLEILTNTMENFPKVGFGFCTVPPNINRMFPFELAPNEAYEYHYFYEGIFNRSPLSAIIRKDVFETIGGFPDRKMVGDYEMWHLLAMNHPVVLMPQGLVWYRRHKDQEMNSVSDYLGDYKDITLKFLEHPDCPMKKDLINLAIRRIKIYP